MGKTYTVAQFAEAIPGSAGIISTIAKRVGCRWNTARARIDASPKLTQMYNDERESLLDMSESVIFASIKNGDTADAKWVLSRLGKHRGYADKLETEVTGQGGGPLAAKVEHKIDSDSAESIFGILEGIGAFASVLGDAETE